MRVLHTLPGRNCGDAQQRVLEQVRWLNRHGHQSWCLTPADGPAYAQAVQMGVPVVPLAFDPPWSPNCMFGLRRFVLENRIDVIHTHAKRDVKAAFFSMDLCAIVRSCDGAAPRTASRLRRWQWRYGADHVVADEDVRAGLMALGLAEDQRSTAIDAGPQQGCCEGGMNVPDDGANVVSESKWSAHMEQILRVYDRAIARAKTRSFPRYYNGVKE